MNQNTYTECYEKAKGYLAVGVIATAIELLNNLIQTIIKNKESNQYSLLLSNAYLLLCEAYHIDGDYERFLEAAFAGRTHVLENNKEEGFSSYWKFNANIALGLDFLGEDEKLGHFLLQIPGLLSIRTSQYDKSHLTILAVKARYAEREGEVYTSIKLLKEIIAHSDNVYTPEDPWMLDIHKHLIQVYLVIPDLDAAKEACTEALSLLQSENSPTMKAWFHALLAEAHMLFGDEDQALLAAKEAITFLAYTSERPIDIAAVFSLLGKTYAHLKQVAAARHSFMRSIEIEEEMFGKSSPLLCFYLEPYGQFLVAQCQFEHAIPILERAISLAKNALSVKEPALRALAECYETLSEHEKAERIYQELEEIDPSSKSWRIGGGRDFEPPLHEPPPENTKSGINKILGLDTPKNPDELHHDDKKDIFYEDSSEKVAEEDALTALHNLIGQDELKEKIQKLFDLQEFHSIRRKQGIEHDNKINIHTVFVGNPGTGKTTVARIYGTLLKSMNLLENGIVHEVDRADLIGKYLGQTAPKTRRAIQKARGGVLFIDEAYSLTPDTEFHDYGAEAIEVLLKEMTSPQCSIAIVCAGYPDEMARFLSKNPGLQSRFGQFFEFHDYSGEQLYHIAEQYAQKRSLHFTADTEEYLRKKLIDAYRKRSYSFGNARFACGVIDEAKMNLANRLISLKDKQSLDRETLTTLLVEDLEPCFKEQEDVTQKYVVQEELLKTSLEKLHQLTGLHAVKRDVDELVTLVRYNLEIGKNVLNRFSLHLVFKGNPGTGKTTVARLLGNIYYALGLLENGKLIECSRESLVGKSWGATAPLVHEKINEAEGGVLFIDEAYTLKQSSDDAFGQEAIDTILKRMEDDRGRFYIICAGYPEEMDIFLSQNPGLRSRFDRHIHFEDYSSEDLFTIALSMIQAEDLRCNDEALSLLLTKLSEAPLTQYVSEGNARLVRLLCEHIVRNQNLRLAKIPLMERSKEQIEEVSAEDITKAVQELEKTGGFKNNRAKPIGFRS